MFPTAYVATMEKQIFPLRVLESGESLPPVQSVPPGQSRPAQPVRPSGAQGLPVQSPTVGALWPHRCHWFQLVSWRGAVGVHVPWRVDTLALT